MRLRLLIALNRSLHDIDDYIRQSALESIRSLTDGRQLPGYHWTPIATRLKRRQRFRRIAAITGLVLVLLLASLVGAWFFTEVEVSNFWVQFLGVLGAIIGAVSGVTTIMGWVVRLPGEN
ncbi:MAG: hypothetical protein AAF639_21085 [Chloroflexota bacterium]